MSYLRVASFVASPASTDTVTSVPSDGILLGMVTFTHTSTLPSDSLTEPDPVTIIAACAHTQIIMVTLHSWLLSME